MGNKLFVVAPVHECVAKGVYVAKPFGKGQTLEITEDLKGIPYKIIPASTFHSLNAGIESLGGRAHTSLRDISVHCRQPHEYTFTAMNGELFQLDDKRNKVPL